MQQIFTGGDALLIIDMLKDFVEAGAPLYVPAAKNIIDNINRYINQARQAGIPVVYVCDAHNVEDSEFKRFPAHAVAGTDGAKIIDELKPLPTDYIVYKRRFSGFFYTNLDLLLRELKINRVVLTGILTDICVYHTAADACSLGYEVVILEACVAALSEEEHKFALKQARRLFGAEIL